MGRKGDSITLSISSRDKSHLEALALALGMTWGDRPNISKLVEAIARQELRVAPNHDWTLERIHTLHRARTALVDAGEIEMAVVIAQLLLERSELSIPLRTELENFIAEPVHPWRRLIETYLLRQQPFQLSYQDAAERIWHFTIRYGEITTHEDRKYLDCWCEETAGNQDLPELAHNWCLRLDRITDAAVSPITGSWRIGLASIPVEFQLFRGLAFAYRSKTNQDTVNEWLTDPPQVRRVVRQVPNTFWFLREVLPYGEDCLIIQPENIRQQIQRKITDLHNLYNPAP
jgi:hypothetical protein